AEVVFRRHLEDNRQEVERRTRAAQVYRYKANIHRLENQTTQAEQLLRETIALLQGLAEEDGEHADVRDRLALTLRDYASLQARLGRLDEAGTTIDQAIQLARNLEKRDGKEVRFFRTEGAALLVRAGIEYARGDFPDAEVTAELAAQCFNRLLTAP